MSYLATSMNWVIKHLCHTVKALSPEVLWTTWWTIIQGRNTIFALITAHAPISAQSSTLVVFTLQSVYFYLLLYKNVCCGYSFDLPQQVQAIQMSTHNICFYKENQKIYHIIIIKYALHVVLCWSFFNVCPYLVDILLQVFAVILIKWKHTEW